MISSINMKYVKLLITIRVMIQFGNSSNITAGVKFNILNSVLRQYQSKCIYVVKSHEHGLDQIEMYTKTIKLFTDEDVMSVVTNYELIYAVFRNVNCQPFVYIDSVTNETTLGLLQTYSEITYNSRVKWLLFEDSMPRIQDLFEAIQVSLDSEILVAHRSGNDGQVRISEIYRVLPKASLTIQEVGTWDEDSGLTWTNRTYSERRRNLNYAVIRKGVMRFGKVMYYTVNEDGKLIQLGGLVFDTWSALMKALNFTSNFTTPKDKAYGVQDDKGTWNGLIRLLIEKEIDVSDGAMTLNDARLQVIDYFTPFLRSRYSIFIKKPYHTDHTISKLLKPLSLNLWLAVLVVMMCFAILLTVTWTFSVSRWKESRVVNYSLLSSSISVFGIFCQRAQDMEPRSWPSRLVFLTAHLTSVVLFVAYAATFISFLTVIKYSMPYTDIEDLTEEGRYKLGLQENTVLFTLFKKTKDPIIKEAYNNLVLSEKNPPQTNEIGFARVCKQDRYAFMTLLLYYKQSKADIHCPVVMVPNTFFPAALSIACTKNSTLRRLFNHYILRMREAGILEVNEARLEPQSDEYDGEKTISASLDNVFPVLEIYITGVIIAVSILLIEVLVFRTNFLNKLKYRVNEFRIILMSKMMHGFMPSR